MNYINNKTLILQSSYNGNTLLSKYIISCFNLYPWVYRLNIMECSKISYNKNNCFFKLLTRRVRVLA